MTVPILPHHVACILLAAGKSSRFGPNDKLLAILHGKPLLNHAADALAALPFADRIVVGSPAVTRYDLPGFKRVESDAPNAPQSNSIALGVAALIDTGCDAILIALADMPFVPSTHFLALMQAFDGPHSIIASRTGSTAMPPALFGKNHFLSLTKLSGDQGARSLLHQAATVPLPSGAEIDIDTREELLRCNSVRNDVK